MATTTELLNAIQNVFGNRDRESRRRAIEASFAEDATFTDPDASVTGWDAIETAAAALLSNAPEDFSLAEDGLQYTSDDAGAVAWTFGRPGAPVARGIDMITVRDGRIATLQTLLHS